MNYYRRYVGDYLRDTSRLSLLEHGAYNVMMDYYYADERPLPVDREELCRMVRAVSPAERGAVDKVLGLFFTLLEDGWHQARVDSEIGVAQATIAKQRESGSEASSKRWSTDRSTNRSTNRSTDGSTDKSEDGSTTPSDDTTTNHQPPTTQPPASNPQGKKARKRASALPADFQISPDIRAWAKPLGYEPLLEKHLDYFRDYCAAKGATYKDHEAAFRNAIKADWGDIRKSANGFQRPSTKPAAHAAAAPAIAESRAARASASPMPESVRGLIRTGT